jgi:glycine cleavage system H protein
MADVSKLKFLESHEWIAVNGAIGTVGISDFAQKEISDIVFVELPKVGRSVKQKEACMVVESVKAAFDIYSPVSGRIVEVNARLEAEPQVVNQSPWDDGWLYRIEIADPKELGALLDAAAYEGQKSKAH